MASVVSNKQVMTGTFLMWLECAGISLEARPGQFVMVHCGEETVLRRPLSIHQADGGKFALLYAIIGKGTQWLSQCSPGVEVDILGPLGNGFMVYPDSRNLLLIAGGIGIAPLMSLADRAISDGRNVILLYGTANKDRYHLPSGVTEVAATEDGSIGYKGMITELVPEHVEWADQIFACGPLPMYRAMAKMSELKNKPVQVSLEMRMGCGMGTCYACTIRTRQGLKQVCKDGPVFDMNDVIWEEIKT
ncbi:MAG TPA: dihydroorotate dehydrogenase electron transfer subunit [Dehalococcoidia bacterium]|nr:dihydroorotate dehydrogenase electron transfer subunit [Dehalococcoidia bacterium]